MPTQPQTMRLVSQVDLFSLEIAESDGKSTLRIPVLPEGKFQHPSYGTLDWTPTKFTAMIANFQAGVTGFQPMLNADHATHNPFAAGAPAYGWPTALEHVTGQGLFAVVELTDLGVEAIRNKRYRYISAEVADTWARSTGATAQHVITGMALTNTPFHDSMPGLFSQRAGAAFWAGNAAAEPAAVPDPELVAQFTRELADRPQLFKMGGDLNFGEIYEAVRDALRAEIAHLPRLYRYVEELYPGFVIYEEYDYAAAVERCTYYRRDYTLAGEVVTLGETATEVEEVWVVKAAAAFRQARHDALKQLGASGSAGTSLPAGQPAQEKQGKMHPIAQFVRQALGLKDGATTEEVAKALDTAPAPAAEPATQPQQHAQPEQDGAIVALTAQVSALVTTVNTLVTNQNNLAQTSAAEKAESVIQGYVREGKITPAMLEGDQGKALREFAQKQPEAFASIWNAAPALVPLSRVGSGGVPAPGEGGGETFEGVAQAYAASHGVDIVAAQDAVAQSRPDLFEQYRTARAQRKA